MVERNGARQGEGGEPRREDPRAEDPRHEEPRREGGRQEPRREAGEDGRAEHQPSTVDAMGKEKHREVIGQRYAASRAKQLLYYGAFVAFIVFGYLGLKIAVAELDKAPAKDRDQAPWSQPDAPQAPLGGFTPRERGARGPANFQ